MFEKYAALALAQQSLGLARLWLPKLVLAGAITHDFTYYPQIRGIWQSIIN